MAFRLHLLYFIEKSEVMIVAINEISKQLQISADKLREYEANGLLGSTMYTEESSGHSEQFIQRICLIDFLLRSGMTTDRLKSYLRLLDKKTESRDEQIRILRKQRCCLLEEIHYKQQILDELDYMIREVMSGGSH